jgi:hypothetical protein
MNPTYTGEIADMVGRLGLQPDIVSLGMVHT